MCLCVSLPGKSVWWERPHEESTDDPSAPRWVKMEENEEGEGAMGILARRFFFHFAPM